MTRDGPPRLETKLLRWILPEASREDVLQDMADVWGERRAAQGRRAANRWYRGQLVLAVLWSVADAAGIGRGREGEGESTGSLRRDVSCAFTQLRRHPGVGAVVILTLALGIGATTAIFSAVHGVLLKPLPYDRPSELVMLTSEMGGSDLPRYVSGPDLLEMEEALGTLDEVALLLEATVGPMTEVDAPEHVLTAPVSWNLFSMLGVEMAMGRSFTSDDAVAVPRSVSAPPPGTAIISHDFWQRSFGGDPGAVGSVVHVWGSPLQVVGVLPEDFRLALPPELNIPPDADVWQTLRWDPRESSRQRREYRAVARLASGASPQIAQQDVDRFAAMLRDTHPHHSAEETGFRVRSLSASVYAPMRGPLWLLMGAVTLVLLIACANVANLLLARGAARSTEMAVRASLGAGRGRLVRQLLTESAVLAAAGAVGGILIAHVGVHALHALRPPDLHALERVGIDVPVLGFTLAVTVVATLLGGLLPAHRTARQGLAGRLGSRSGTGAMDRVRSTLIVTQVAMSLVLLVGAGLLIRTFGELQRMPLGFEPEQVLTVTATQSTRPQAERQAYEAELLQAARAVPGVIDAGIVFPLPMNGVYERSAEYAVDGRETDPAAWTTVYFRTVSPEYFDVMGLELLRGRRFTETDETHGVPVVVLDERLARREFPGEDPIGRPLWVRGMGSDTLRAEIVGVAEYAPQWDHRDVRPTLYFPRVLYQSHEVSLVARVSGRPEAVAAPLSAAVRSVDPSFPSDLVPMEDFVRERLARSRFLLTLMQILGALALALSAVGLYGVLTYSVRQRTRELGLRMALGAEGWRLIARVVGGGLELAAVGIGLGLVGALAFGHALRTQLFRVGAADPAALAGATALVLAVSVISSLIPALRAARVDPTVALREE